MIFIHAIVLRIDYQGDMESLAEHKHQAGAQHPESLAMKFNYAFAKYNFSVFYCCFAYVKLYVNC